MNNKRPGMGEQLLRSLLLSFAIMWLISTFFGWPGQKKDGQPVTRDPKLEAQATIENAFAGLNSGQPVSAEAAKDEVGTLQKAIEANAKDKYAMWAHLRSGLLQQYVLKEPAAALKNYDAVIQHGTPDAVDAQAIFQKGDWQWFSAPESLRGASTSANTAAASAVTPPPTRVDAAVTLETLIHRGRGASEYIGTNIFVPALAQGQESYDPNVLPANGFKQVKVGELKGTVDSHNPQGILDRINDYYSTTWLNKGMDAMVNAFGAKPEYSYGLAIVALAIGLRVLMQPINRRQYESMRGMAKIAPEMKKIQEKYKAKPNDSPEVARDKQMKSFKEVSQLQKDNGVNMQMGCLLGFVQMPVFFYIINPLMLHYEPKMELVGASFGWISSLARPDYILLALYGVSMLVSFRLSAQPPTAQMDEMQKQMQIMTTWVMPIMLPFFMKGFSSAFILYWMSFNIVSMLFQTWMIKQSDPDRNILKSLLGQFELPHDPAAPEAAPAIPPRPKSTASLKSKSADEKAAADTVKVARVKSLSAQDAPSETATPHANGANGHANGSASGSVTMEKAKGEGTAGGSGSSGAAQGGNNASAAQRARRRRRY